MQSSFSEFSKTWVKKALRSFNQSCFWPCSQWKVELESSGGPFQPELSCAPMILPGRHMWWIVAISQRKPPETGISGWKQRVGGTEALNIKSVDQEKKVKALGYLLHPVDFGLLWQLIQTSRAALSRGHSCIASAAYRVKNVCLSWKSSGENRRERAFLLLTENTAVKMMAQDLLKDHLDPPVQSLCGNFRLQSNQSFCQGSRLI